MNLSYEDFSSVGGYFIYLGIPVKNKDGSNKEPNDILDEIIKVWKSLNYGERHYIATHVAGVRKREMFLALMNSLSKERI